MIASSAGVASPDVASPDEEGELVEPTERGDKDWVSSGSANSFTEDSLARNWWIGFTPQTRDYYPGMTSKRPGTGAVVGVDAGAGPIED